MTKQEQRILGDVLDGIVAVVNNPDAFKLITTAELKDIVKFGALFIYRAAMELRRREIEGIDLPPTRAEEE